MPSCHTAPSSDFALAHFSDLHAHGQGPRGDQRHRLLVRTARALVENGTLLIDPPDPVVGASARS